MHTVQLEEKDNQGNLLLMNLSVSTVTIAALTIATVSSSTTPRPSRPTAQSCMWQFLQKALTPARQNAVDEEQAKMIAQDYQLRVTRDLSSVRCLQNKKVCYWRMDLQSFLQHIDKCDLKKQDKLHLTRK